MSKNWREKEIGKELATFKSTNTLVLTFQNDGVLETTQIKQNNGTIKETEQLRFSVVDYTDGKEKDFTTTSARCREALSLVANDLTGLTIKIDKIGSGFSTQYTAVIFEPVSKPKPKPTQK